MSGARNMTVHRPPATTGAGQHAAATSSAPHGPAVLEVTGRVLWTVGALAAFVMVLLGVPGVAVLVFGLAAGSPTAAAVMGGITAHPWWVLLALVPVLVGLVGKRLADASGVAR